MKNLRYLIEAAALYLLYFIFRLLPLDTASALGGWLGRQIGTHMGISRLGLKHIGLAFPDVSEKEQKQILVGMWDNLGRIVAEYPHLKKICKERLSVEGEDILRKAFESGQPSIVIGGHVGSWEVMATMMHVRFKANWEITYRAMNNPFADNLLWRARTLKGKIPAHPKSRTAGRDIVDALKQGHSIGILIDQKYNEGVAVSFFGRPALTNPAFVRLAQKYQCPVIPVWLERTEGAHFKAHVDEPIPVFMSSGETLPVETVIAQAHVLLENRIRQRPEQWLWLHRRWDSEQLRAN